MPTKFQLLRHQLLLEKIVNMLKETKTRYIQLLITGYENCVVSFDGITIDLVCPSVIMKLLMFYQKIFNCVMLY